MDVAAARKYSVPSMDEIAAVRGSNKLKVVSTFSGCGGSCLGFEMAGYDVVWACEFIPAARETYLLNHPGVHVDGRDIREVRPSDILRATGLREGELDVLEGSPPCASFSTAGKREKAWGKTKKYSDSEQRSDDLFFEYARLLEGLRPRAFVAENVSGLVKGQAWGYFEQIIRALKRCGYRVKAKVLDAQWLGVPQMRQRLIFVGVREDLGVDPVHPEPFSHRYSIRDALPHLKSVVHDTSGAWGAGEVIGRPSPTITVGMDSINSCHFKVREAEPGDLKFPEGNGKTNFRTGKVWSGDKPAPTIMAGDGQLGGTTGVTVVGPPAPRDFSKMAIGKEWRKLKPGETSDRYFNLVRPDERGPCPTVTAAGGGDGTASVTHPHEPRKFTIPELKRLCGFPDDFELTGKFAQQWERLGRSVPPVMMFHVARTLRDGVFAKLEKPCPRSREVTPT
jgi:DNA (cytosine-5)-methyltransferase 1